jgi:hypothetical protein
MNYTLNRPLLDGTSPARLKEVGEVVPLIKDYDSWHTAWLGLAQKAESEQRWLDAASYYHGAEFYLPAGDARNELYDDFARTWARGMEGVAGYERIEVPYSGGALPGFRLQAKGKERSTFVFNGGYDSFVEEFYAFLLPLTELGFTVVAFDGPGQGGALRQGTYFEHAWEKPAKAVIDHLQLDAVDWLGASCGGRARPGSLSPCSRRATGKAPRRSSPRSGCRAPSSSGASRKGCTSRARRPPGTSWSPLRNIHLRESFTM